MEHKKTEATVAFVAIEKSESVIDSTVNDPEGQGRMGMRTKTSEQKKTPPGRISLLKLDADRKHEGGKV